MFKSGKIFKYSKKVKIISLYGLIGVVVLLSWFSYSVYEQQRWNAYYAVSEIHRIVYNTYEDIERMDTNEFAQPFNLENRLNNLLNETTRLKRHFNFYENMKEDQNTNLYLNNRYFNQAMTKLKLRNQQELWSQIDKKYYETLLTHMETLSSAFKEENEDFKSSKILSIFNKKEISEQVVAINRLNYSYVSSHQVTDLEVMDKGSLKEEIAKQLASSVKDIQINIRNSPDVISKEYTFEIEKGIRGEISPYTGLVTRIDHNARGKTDVNLSKEDAERAVVDFLNQIFNSENQYQVTYKGINHKHSFSGSGVPDIKLHSFYAVPINGGFPYLQPSTNHFGVYIDQNTGEVFDFNMTRLGSKTNNFFSKDFFNTTFKAIVSKEEAADKLLEFEKNDLLENHVNIEEYSFKQTGIIYSTLSGEFELVHEFQGNNKYDQIFVNATEGYLEKPYIVH